MRHFENRIAYWIFRQGVYGHRLQRHLQNRLHLDINRPSNLQDSIEEKSTARPTCSVAVFDKQDSSIFEILYYVPHQ